MATISFYIGQFSSTRDAILQTLHRNPTNIAVAPPFDTFCKKLWPENEPYSRYFGSWSRHHLLYHLISYERDIALPHFQLWLDGIDDYRKIPGQRQRDARYNNQATFYDPQIPVNQLIAEFEQIRRHQLESLQQLSVDHLSDEKETLWGKTSLDWVLTKTIAHSFEHGTRMYRQAIYWNGSYAVPTLLKQHVEQLLAAGQSIDMSTYNEFLDFIVTHP